MAKIRRRPLALGVLGLALAACGYADPGPAAGSGSTGAVQAVVGNPPVNPCTPTPGGDDFHAGANLKQITLPDGLKYVDLTVGTGAVATGGSEVTMQYTGWLTNCTVFDTSRQSGRTPFDFTIGQGQVIKGWDEGIPGMKVGGKRKLIIPPQLGYGSQGQGSTIPANATLIFEVELLTVKPGASPSPSP